MAVSTGQLGLLHVGKTQLGLDDDEYRDLLERVAGVRSAKNLTSAGFEQVLAHMQRLGFTTRRAARSYGHRPGMATPDQIEYVRDLWCAYTGDHDDAALNRWLEHFFGVSALRFVNASTVGKAITALKTMGQRRARSTG